MHLATFLDLVELREETIRSLSLKYKPAEQELLLGFTLNIPDWIGQGFKRLLTLGSLYDYQASHRVANTLGVDLYECLAVTKENLQAYRQMIAVNPPALVHGRGCTNPEGCKSSWRSYWWGTFCLNRFLHPEKPIPFDEVISALQSEKIPGMLKSCKDLTLADTRTKATFTHPAAMIEAEIEKLKGKVVEPERAVVVQRQG